MTRLARPFIRIGELMLVEAELRGPRSTLPARLVVDTGASSTTLIPEFIEDLGYSARDGVRPKKMHTALSEEEGYTLKVAEFSVLGVTTPNFMIHVFDLGHEGFDGLLGMNFLRHFNFEVRPGDQKIMVELISGDWEVVDDGDG